MDETGQAGSPDEAGGYPGAGYGPHPGVGRSRPGYPEAHVNGGAPTDDALEAIVSAWREPATGAIAGRASVTGIGLTPNGANGNGHGHNGNGHNGNGQPRGRAEVRNPYSDLLAPMSPPVSAPPPVQPPTSTLHYGHYGPDGQGWPTSAPTSETPAVPAPPPGTVYGALPVDQQHSGEVHRPVSAQPAYDPQAAYAPRSAPPAPLFGPQPPFDVEPPPAAAPAPDPWAYHYQQPEPQPQPQRQWPEPPEFDWAAPSQPQPVVSLPPAPPPPPPAVQPLPTQRVPEDDPLVGPLPPVLLGSATPMTAEPVMPTFADDMREPAYEPPVLPQRIPAEPDVPAVPVSAPPPVAGPLAGVGAAELTRITNHLREEEDIAPGPPDDRPDGFDIDGVVRAVQSVSGVHRATLRKNADGLHTLRLELLDEADAGQVSRVVARMLNETMGLSAEPNLPAALALPPAPELPARPSSRNSPHSALPGYGREARRRRPVSSGARRAEERPAEAPAALAPQAPALVPNPGTISSPRVVIESVDVNTQGIDATVEVRLTADNQPAVGVASGPNFDGYILKLAALAAGSAVDQLLVDADATVRARCYIEHAAVVPMGGCEVAVVVLLLMYDGFVEQLTGSAVVAADGDTRQAVVRATMAAVNRRLEALLP